MRILVLAFVSIAALPAFVRAADDGTVRGRISPEGVPVEIIAKRAGSDAGRKENRKGELLLEKGGHFVITGLPPGKYDLLFRVSPEWRGRFIATRWSEIRVGPGMDSPRIDYRLTPAGASYLVDEVIVGFHPAREEAAMRLVRSLGCVVKDEVLRFADSAFVTVDIPDDMTVAEMVGRFRRHEAVISASANAIGRFDGPSSEARKPANPARDGR